MSNIQTKERDYANSGGEQKSKTADSDTISDQTSTCQIQEKEQDLNSTKTEETLPDRKVKPPSNDGEQMKESTPTDIRSDQTKDLETKDRIEVNVSQSQMQEKTKDGKGKEQESSYIQTKGRDNANSGGEHKSESADSDTISDQTIEKQNIVKDHPSTGQIQEKEQDLNSTKTEETLPDQKVNSPSYGDEQMKESTPTDTKSDQRNDLETKDRMQFNESQSQMQKTTNEKDVHYSGDKQERGRGNATATQMLDHSDKTQQSKSKPEIRSQTPSSPNTMYSTKQEKGAQKDRKSLVGNDLVFEFPVINKRTIGKVMVQVCGNTSVGSTENEAFIRHHLETLSDFVSKDEKNKKWKKATVYVYDKHYNFLRIVSGNGKHKFHVSNDEDNMSAVSEETRDKK